MHGKYCFSICFDSQSAHFLVNLLLALSYRLRTARVLFISDNAPVACGYRRLGHVHFIDLTV